MSFIIIPQKQDEVQMGDILYLLKKIIPLFLSIGLFLTS